MTVRKFLPGEALRAERLNQLVDGVNAVEVTGTHPIVIDQFNRTYNVRYDEQGFWAIITGVLDLDPPSSSSGYSQTCFSSDSSALPMLVYYHRWVYSFQEISPIPVGGWQFLDQGRQAACAAWEWNDVQVETGKIVWMEPVYEGDWRFNYSSTPASSLSSSSPGQGCPVQLITALACAESSTTVETQTLSGTVTDIYGNVLNVCFNLS